VTLSKLLAPFTPFIAEDIYQNLVRTVDKDAPESVHLAPFPVADEKLIDADIIAGTELAMKVCSMGRAARSKSQVKVRQPLPRVVVRARSSHEKEALQKLCSQITDELNVKDMEFISDEMKEDKDLSVVAEGDYQVGIVTELTPELVKEGLAREIVRRLQTMRKTHGLEIADHIRTYYEGGEQVQAVMKDFADYIKQETLSKEILHKPADPGAYIEKFKLSGLEITLSIVKQD
jgi:isoleucyl-tRNA synthetase